MDCWGSGPTLEQKFACFERFRMDLGCQVVALWPCANSHLRAGGDARSVRNFLATNAKYRISPQEELDAELDDDSVSPAALSSPIV